MIHPSYSELIEAINTNNEDDDQSMVLNSRYSLVLATSKRARQLIAGSKPLVEKAAGKKPLSIAIEELYKGKVKILPGKSEDEELSLEENPASDNPDGNLATGAEADDGTDNPDVVTADAGDIPETGEDGFSGEDADFADEETAMDEEIVDESFADTEETAED